MRRGTYWITPFALTVAPAPIVAQSCQPVRAAFTALAKTDRYQAVGTTMANGKQYPTNEIYLNGTLDKGMASQWAKASVTPAERLAADEQVGATLADCRVLRTEAVAGQAATVYAAHEHTTDPPTKNDMQVWISNSSGLPLRVDGDASFNNGAPLHSSRTYTYGAGVKAPAGV
jgi:hypothetical protein